MKHKGLGDSLDWLFRKTGIQSLVYFVSDLLGVECGCEERRDFLNQKINYSTFNFSIMKNFFRWVSDVFERRPLIFSLSTGFAIFALTIFISNLFPGETEKGIVAAVGFTAFILFAFLLSEKSR